MRPPKYYHRLDVDFDTNPKVIAAHHQHPEADRVYRVLLGINTKHECDGRIPRALASDVALGRKTVSSPSAGAVRDALHALEAHDLIAREADGTVILRGWDETWIPIEPESSATRMRSLRRRRRGAGMIRVRGGGADEWMDVGGCGDGE